MFENFIDACMPVLSHPLFWVVLGIIGLTGAGWIYVKGLRKIPVIGKLVTRQNLLFAGGIGFLVVSGLLGSFSAGSIAGSNVDILSSQITTAFATDLGGTIAASTLIPNTIDVRLTDAQVNETASFEELSTGVIKVTRKDASEAGSCNVRAIIPPDYVNMDGSDANTLYHLVERDAMKNVEAYILAGSTSAAASLSSSKETATLAFAEGVADGYVGFMVELSETGHDAMTQYASLPIYLDICGEVYTYNFHRQD